MKRNTVIRTGIATRRHSVVLAMSCAFGAGAMLSAGEPMFRVHEIGRPGGNYFGQTSAVDVDQDGDLDFISGRQFGDVFWFENRGGGGWREHLIGHKALTDAGGVAFDVDGDGDGCVDQVSGGTWFRNPGSPRGAAEWRRHENGATPTHDNLAADIDGDGDGDIDILTKPWNGDLHFFVENLYKHGN